MWKSSSTCTEQMKLSGTLGAERFWSTEFRTLTLLCAFLLSFSRPTVDDNGMAALWETMCCTYRASLLCRCVHPEGLGTLPLGFFSVIKGTQGLSGAGTRTDDDVVILKLSFYWGHNQKRNSAESQSRKRGEATTAAAPRSTRATRSCQLGGLWRSDTPRVVPSDTSASDTSSRVKPFLQSPLNHFNGYSLKPISQIVSENLSRKRCAKYDSASPFTYGGQRICQSPVIPQRQACPGIQVSLRSKSFVQLFSRVSFFLIF